MASEDTRAGRAQPEAELLAAGSATPRVKLAVTNVYDSSTTEEVVLDPMDTILKLKLMLQKSLPNRPSPLRQRLIFHGKQCEEGQQLWDVLQGVDLATRQTFHLVVTQPTEANLRPATALEQPSREAMRPPDASATTTRNIGVGVANASVTRASGAADALPGAAAQPERVQLSSAQMEQLQCQYQQALREQQQALQQQQQRYQYLAWQCMALAQQNGRAPSSGAPWSSEPHPLYQVPSQWPAAESFEVATSAATRALGGSMPGPTIGGAVRDITRPAPEMIQEAGLEGENGRPARHNLVDPAPVPAPARVNRGRLLMQLCALVFVFGADAKEWQLLLLGLGAGLVFLYKTGVLAILLGEGREGGGLWKAVCTGATVIPDDGGFLTDVRVFTFALIASVFPPWKPTRSPAAIAAEAAAREAAAAAAAAEAANQRAEVDAAVRAQAADDAQAELAQPAAIGVD